MAVRDPDLPAGGNRSMSRSLMIAGGPREDGLQEDQRTSDLPPAGYSCPISQMCGAKRNRRRKVVGLFAGIGGLEHGLHLGGAFDTVALCDNDPAAGRVLGSRFDAPLHTDVRKLTSSKLPERVDVLTAGFPCQDLSQAGSLAGMQGDRSSLVDEVLRLLRGMRRAGRPVPWIVLENVPFMLHLAKGDAMRYVTTELERRGYEWAYRVVDAQAFGLPQRRRRVFIVASCEGNPADVLLADEAEPRPVADWDFDQPIGFYWTEGNRGMGRAIGAVPTMKGGSGFGIPSPPAALMPDGRVLTPSIESAEALQGFDRGWTAAATGTEAKLRWRMVGNAVSVRVAQWTGQRLDAPGRFDESRIGEPVTSTWPKAAVSTADGPRAVVISEWPARAKPEALSKFLRDGKPLSARATRGFTDRLERASKQGLLRVPPEFLEALRRHQRRMEQDDARSAGAQR